MLARRRHMRGIRELRRNVSIRTGLPGHSDDPILPGLFCYVAERDQPSPVASRRRATGKTREEKDKIDPRPAQLSFGDKLIGERSTASTRSGWLAPTRCWPMRLW